MLNTAVSMPIVLAACLLGFLVSMRSGRNSTSRVNLALGMLGSFLYLMVVSGIAYLLAAVVPSASSPGQSHT